MKAVYIKEFGEVENLSLLEVQDVHEPVSDEVRVRVKAAGLNRADILQRLGRYPAPQGSPERIPGLEFSGVIEALGESVESFSIGDRVMGIVPGGAQAELLKTRATLLSRIPDQLSFEDAAAVPEAFVTAFDALILQAGLESGESVLIHAVGSGVGLAAAQIAGVLGANVYGTSRSAEKLTRMAEFRLEDSFLVADEGRFADRIKEICGGVDVILDLVGARYLKENLDSLKPKGRLMLVGLTGGTKTDLDLSTVLSKRLTLKGTVLRSRTFSEREELTAAFNQRILPLFESGLLRPNVDSIYPAEQIREANLRMERNENFGKVIVTF